MINFDQLLADELVPIVRVRYGPNLEDMVELNQLALEASKADIIALCLSIPNVWDGLSWPQLLPYTGQNGLYAKLLVALGEMFGIWSMHPAVEFPEMWITRLHPMIAAHSINVPQQKSGVRKCADCGDFCISREEMEFMPGYEECDLCDQARTSEEKEAELPKEMNSYLNQFR